MNRRYGSQPDPGRRYQARPGVYAVLPRGDGVLLTFQERPRAEFQLPGGGIDPGESPIHALHREVFEETGWRIARPRRLGMFRRFTFMPDYDIWAEKLCHIYRADPIRPHGDPLEPGHSAVWVAAGQASQVLATEGDRRFAAQLGL